MHSARTRAVARSRAGPNTCRMLRSGAKSRPSGIDHIADIRRQS